MPTNVRQKMQETVDTIISHGHKSVLSYIESCSKQMLAQYSFLQDFAWLQTAADLGQLSQLTTVCHPKTNLPFSFLPGTAKRVVVIGDLHGDWVALLNILSMLDKIDFFTDPNNFIVFLGDYIDRGNQQLRVLIGVLYLKAMYFRNVILLRGNHEDEWQCETAGFYSELSKYVYPEALNELPLFQKICEKFDLLPIYALTHTGILFVHGGPYFKVQPPPTIIDLLARDHAWVEIGDDSIIPALWVDPLSYYEFRLCESRFPSLPLPLQQICNLSSLSPFKIRRVVRGHEVKTLATQNPFLPITTVFSTGGRSQDAYEGYTTDVPEPFIADINIPADDIRFYPIQ